MKKLSTLLLLSLSPFFFSQNLEISTLRIGDFKVFMPKAEADKLANKNLIVFDDYDKSNKVNINGEIIDIMLAEQWIDDKKPLEKQVYVIKTKSTKYKTKSGMGVGNTKDQLIDTYRNYSNFEVRQYRNENGKPESESFFTLSDYDAGTYLTFKLKNNIVTEVLVGINEGC